MRTRWSVVVAVLVGNLLFSSANSFAADPEPLRVSTESGIVEGVLEDGARVFRGIPYTAPPIGDLRWRAPQPPHRWTGIRSAKEFGPVCPQRRRGAAEKSEDCLTLNVWSPPGADKLPVMLWIHGGAYIGGSGNTDGSTFVRDGVVLVSLNYRLGRLGVFAHPALSREAQRLGEPTGNFGLLDQISGLRWIKRNIATFGGDPGRITIFGVSAGGGYVNSLMASPMAAGLFHGAISQSGPNGLSIARRALVAEQAGLGVAESKGVKDLAGLRKLRWQDLVDADASYRNQSTPFIDGRAVTDDVPEIFRNGRQNDVPYIAGSNSFEGSLARAIPIPAIDGYVKANAEEITAVYGRQPDDPLLPLIFYGDILFAAPTHNLVAKMTSVGSRGWIYYMDHVMEGLQGKVPGTSHGGEVRYVFDNLKPISISERISRAIGIPAGNYQPSEKDHATAATVHNYWVQFAKTGDPNGKNLPKWPDCTIKKDQTLIVSNDGIAVQRDFRKLPLSRIEANYEERRKAALKAESGR